MINTKEGLHHLLLNRKMFKMLKIKRFKIKIMSSIIHRLWSRFVRYHLHRHHQRLPVRGNGNGKRREIIMESMDTARIIITKIVITESNHGPKDLIIPIPIPINREWR